MANYFTHWAEIWFFSLIVGGFIVALFSGSAVISYLVIFLVGMIAGRTIYERKEQLKLSYILLMSGFLIGYAIGILFGSYGNINVIVVLFIMGYFLSYYIHDKGLLHTIKY